MHWANVGSILDSLARYQYNNTHVPLTQCWYETGPVSYCWYNAVPPCKTLAQPHSCCFNIDHHLRHWTNITPALVKLLLFADLFRALQSTAITPPPPNYRKKLGGGGGGGDYGVTPTTITVKQNVRVEVRMHPWWFLSCGQGEGLWWPRGFLLLMLDPW